MQGCDDGARRTAEGDGILRRTATGSGWSVIWSIAGRTRCGAAPRCARWATRQWSRSAITTCICWRSRWASARLRGDDTLDGHSGGSRPRRAAGMAAGRPLMHEDPALNLCMVHAGLAPQWDLATAAACAREIEQALRGDPKRCSAACTAMSRTAGTWLCTVRTGCASSSTASRVCAMSIADGRLVLKRQGLAQENAGEVADTLVRGARCALARSARGVRPLVDAGISSTNGVITASIPAASGAAASPHCGSTCRTPNPCRWPAGRTGSLRHPACRLTAPRPVPCPVRPAGSRPYQKTAAALLIGHTGLSSHAPRRELRQHLSRKLVDQFAVRSAQVTKRVAGERERLVARVDRREIAAMSTAVIDPAAPARKRRC